MEKIGGYISVIPKDIRSIVSQYLICHTCMKVKNECEQNKYCETCGVPIRQKDLPYNIIWKGKHVFMENLYWRNKDIPAILINKISDIVIDYGEYTAYVGKDCEFLKIDNSGNISINKIKLEEID